MDFPGIDSHAPVSDEDCHFLSSFLASDRVSKKTMMFDEVEGLLTGMICGPTKTLPSNWLLMIWGDDAPVFDSEEEAMRVIGTIFRLYNEMNVSLRTGKTLRLMLPVNKVGGKEIIIADGWCSGFTEGMKLWDPCWQNYLDKNLSKCLGAIVIVGTPEFDDGLVEKGVNVDEILDSLPDVLPFFVRDIYDQLAPCRKKITSGHVPQARKKKTARNDPCPCGSGKKFKKCCAGLTIH